MDIHSIQNSGDTPYIQLKWIEGYYDGPMSGWLTYHDKWCFFESLGDYLIDEIYFSRLYGIYPASADEVAAAFKRQIKMLLTWGDHYSFQPDGSRTMFDGKVEPLPEWWRDDEDMKKEPPCDYLIDVFVI